MPSPTSLAMAARRVGGLRDHDRLGDERNPGPTDLEWDFPELDDLLTDIAPAVLGGRERRDNWG
ncbi:MAG: hypothetical protein NTY19_47770 [Planctomycetota bacterium]|nr:hypothetical protein [Planctomycetota bacterium]